MIRMNEGWLLRVYAAQQEDVPKRVERVAAMAEQIGLNRGPIVALVPSDKDCGQTADALRDQVKSVIVLECPGSPNTDVLNQGLQTLANLGCSHAVIASNKAIEAVTPRTMFTIERAVNAGACVAGVAFDEFATGVQEGMILNTFAAWDLGMATKFGGFVTEHPTKGGCEEISLLAKFCREVRDPFIAVIKDPKVVAQVMNTTEAQERFAKILTSKVSRQDDLLKHEGITREQIKAAVISQM